MGRFETRPRYGMNGHGFPCLSGIPHPMRGWAIDAEVSHVVSALLPLVSQSEPRFDMLDPKSCIPEGLLFASHASLDPVLRPASRLILGMTFRAAIVDLSEGEDLFSALNEGEEIKREAQRRSD